MDNNTQKIAAQVSKLGCLIMVLGIIVIFALFAYVAIFSQ